ncbi:MAG TPA: DUF3300 domain-containing protein [Bryobacteraceae bacterium]|nr:DUF3300 domain-containing protein [Bryobacteraceae bacterium]
MPIWDHYSKDNIQAVTSGLLRGLRGSLWKGRAGAACLAVLFLLCAGVSGYPAQSATAPSQPGGPLPPRQLDNLVAPIALYPDPLVAEILAASTYPVEIAEEEQWVRDHSHWKPSKLMDNVKKQNWDPSVQGLVAFPDVLGLLTQNMGWTTQLGNAFLGQQMDVMQAVQRMRAAAESKGILHSTPQETVATQNQNGQPEITIEPANPDVWYVPNYNPAYVWGPPAWGAYPPLLYPGIDIGLGWYPGVDLGLYFGGWGGWGWGGWGWSPNWYGGRIFTDHSFFHRYGFRDFGEGGMLGNSEWMHNPEHRLGVPYAGRGMPGRFGGNTVFDARGSRFADPPQPFGRGVWPPEERFGRPGFEQRGWTGNHSVFGGYHNGGMARIQSDRGFSSMGAGRRFGGFGGAMGGGARSAGRR